MSLDVYLYEVRRVRGRGEVPKKPATDPIEAVAKVIYDQWVDRPGYVPWVSRGNSKRQDDARKLARQALADGVGERNGS